MPKKKTEEVEETTEVVSTEATEETAVETQSADAEAVAESSEVAETVEEKVEAVEAQAKTEETPKKGGKKKTEETNPAEETSIVDSVIETVAAAVETVADAVTSGIETIVSAVSGDTKETGKKTSKRAEKIGVVQSDKMTNTVTVRVDRVVKHPIYRKYVKRRKNFMAHDDKGAAIGDKVRIIETRPLSARKRWRVVEIIQKAEK